MCYQVSSLSMTAFKLQSERHRPLFGPVCSISNTELLSRRKSCHFHLEFEENKKMMHEVISQSLEKKWAQQQGQWHYMKGIFLPAVSCHSSPVREFSLSECTFLLPPLSDGFSRSDAPELSLFSLCPLLMPSVLLADLLTAGSAFAACAFVPHCSLFIHHHHHYPHVHGLAASCPFTSSSPAYQRVWGMWCQGFLLRAIQGPLPCVFLDSIRPPVVSVAV